MISLAHLSIFLTVFFLSLALVRVLPGILAFFRERYQINAQQTARELSKFFITIKPAKVLMGSAVLAVALGVLSSSWVVALAILTAGALAPRALLSIWKGIRSAKFDAQLMDGLILIGNSLKSGLDIIAGVERVATSMSAPISEEFNLVLNAYRLGAPLEEALMELTTRIQSRNLETVVYAINIQRETGGNLIKTFDQLVMTIREESKLQKKVAAMTSQSRMQIIFLAAFPWVLAALFYVVAPDFMQPALTNSWGQLILLFLILWEAIGVVITKKIVAVDV